MRQLSQRSIKKEQMLLYHTFTQNAIIFSKKINFLVYPKNKASDRYFRQPMIYENKAMRPATNLRPINDWLSNKLFCPVYCFSFLNRFQHLYVP